MKIEFDTHVLYHRVLFSECLREKQDDVEPWALDYKVHVLFLSYKKKANLQANCLLAEGKSQNFRHLWLEMIFH